MLEVFPSAWWFASGPGIIRATVLRRSLSTWRRNTASTKTIAVKEPRKADKAEFVSILSVRCNVATCMIIEESHKVEEGHNAQIYTPCIPGV